MLALALGKALWEIDLMPQWEIESWREFYRLYPFDDNHRHYRPAALVAKAMSGIKIEDSLKWLQPDADAYDYSDADMRTLNAFGLKPPRMH